MSTVTTTEITAAELVAGDTVVTNGGFRLAVEQARPFGSAKTLVSIRRPQDAANRLRVAGVYEKVWANDKPVTVERAA